MYGNEGEKWIMVKPLSLNNLKINEVGSEFEIAQYHSVPHGYASIEYESCLIYIPDKVFEEHFVKKNIYDQYAKLGDLLYINANGNLGSYTIENIAGDGHYVTLQLERI